MLLYFTCWDGKEETTKSNLYLNFVKDSLDCCFQNKPETIPEEEAEARNGARAFQAKGSHVTILRPEVALWTKKWPVCLEHEWQGMWFSSVAQSCLTLQPHGLQHARPPCPSPTPRVYPNLCPLSFWCHPTISFSVIPFSFCLQSLPASGFFPMRLLLHPVAKVLELQLQHHSFQWTLRTNFLSMD